ncbi:MAG: hypothetical protein KKD83_00640 [Chloroflexi bacterium]|nr:hypothetical protein [Chloroflexota bacterium]
MEGEASRSSYLARVISKITNPCILSVLVLLLMAFTESTNVGVLIGWAAIVFLFLVLLPLVYVYIRTSKSRGGTKLLSNPTLFLKQHPRDILILGLLLGLPCLVILVVLEAPPLLISTLAALLASSIVTALFNIFYRVSYHLAAVTVLMLMAALTWGQIYFVLLAVIPLVGWAKYRIHEHTPAQLAMGVAVSVAISGAIIKIYSIL